MSSQDPKYKGLTNQQKTNLDTVNIYSEALIQAIRHPETYSNEHKSILISMFREELKKMRSSLLL